LTKHIISTILYRPQKGATSQGICRFGEKDMQKFKLNTFSHT